MACPVSWQGLTPLDGLVFLSRYISPDAILCGWLGSKHQLTNYWVMDCRLKAEHVVGLDIKWICILFFRTLIVATGNFIMKNSARRFSRGKPATTESSSQEGLGISNWCWWNLHRIFTGIFSTAAVGSVKGKASQTTNGPRHMKHVELR